MKKYDYIILKYCHDSITGEFVNVGVILLSEDRYLGAHFNSRYTRIKQLFSAVEKENHRQLMGYLQRRFNTLGIEAEDQLPITQRSINELAHSVLPPDDSAYQWSNVESGFTLSPENECIHLFNRLVCHYENKKEKTRRGDDEVWSSFNEELRKKKLSVHLKEAKLVTSDYAYNFHKTYKNGKLHLLEALSFDLEEVSKITEKAVRWHGRASALQAAEPHEFWFLIGNVESEKRKREVAKALNILNKIDAPKRFIQESDKEALSDQLESLISS